MRPLVAQGDEVEVVPLHGPPTVGDIVLARRTAGELVCHRVIALMSDGGVWLVGDDSSNRDRLPFSALLGRVQVVFREDRQLRLHGALARKLDRLLAAIKNHELLLRQSGCQGLRRLGGILGWLRRAALRGRALAWRRLPSA